LRDVAEEIRGRGADVAVVGSGTPDQAEAFRQEFQVPFPVYVDPSLRAYRAGRFRRGVARTLGPAALAAGFRAFRSGFRQGRTQGDPWQLGGVVVLGPGNKVHFEHRSAAAGDHADPDEILAALRV
jgi:hypothetical protein